MGRAFDVRLTPEQKEALVKRARAEGVSEAELVRRLVGQAAGKKREG